MEEMFKKFIRVANSVEVVNSAIKTGIIPGNLTKEASNIILEFYLVNWFCWIMYLRFFNYFKVGGLHLYMPQKSWTNCKLKTLVRSMEFNFFNMLLRCVFVCKHMHACAFFFKFSRLWDIIKGAWMCLFVFVRYPCSQLPQQQVLMVH